jgi:glycerol-3-phosphate dehydrogenase
MWPYLGARQLGNDRRYHIYIRRIFRLKLGNIFRKMVAYMNKTLGIHSWKEFRSARHPNLNNLDETSGRPIFWVLAVPSQSMPRYWKTYGKNKSDTIIVAIAKGHRAKHLKRMSEFNCRNIGTIGGQDCHLHGPSHAEELLARCRPRWWRLTQRADRQIVQEVLRFRISGFIPIRLVGVEIGGAVKNIIAIAAGIL